MKRNNIEDNRFRVEWVSAGEGKKWQGIMTEMSEVVSNLPAAKPPKKPTKTKAAAKPKTKKKTTSKKTTKSKKTKTTKKKSK